VKVTGPPGLVLCRRACRLVNDPHRPVPLPMWSQQSCRTASLPTSKLSGAGTLRIGRTPATAEQLSAPATRAWTSARRATKTVSRVQVLPKVRVTDQPLVGCTVTIQRSAVSVQEMDVPLSTLWTGPLDPTCVLYAANRPLTPSSRVKVIGSVGLGTVS
jgi:hypothetical protein